MEQDDLSIDERCGSCGQALLLGSKHIGKCVQCPTCQNVIKIQLSEKQPTSPIEPKRVTKTPIDTLSANAVKPKPTATARHIITCPGCRTKMAVPNSLHDTAFQCPNCSRRMRLAATDASQKLAAKPRPKWAVSSGSDVLMTIDDAPDPSDGARQNPKS